jgi:oxygen-independent coproporphyrinogen-3 oxidase
MDLIVGARGESLADVEATVRDILSLASPPPHISCYVLTPEPGTPLGEDAARHPDEDHEADAYATVGTLLEAAGYQWEEISNWARPGHEGRHNHVYWNHGNYRGFGSAAHSHIEGRRFWNVRTPDRYISLLQRGESPEGGEEVVAPDAQQFERESLALRTRRGVPLEAFDSLHEIAHLIAVEEGNVTLRPEGRLVANQVIVRLRSSNYERPSGSL